MENGSGVESVNRRSLMVSLCSLWAAVAVAAVGAAASAPIELDGEYRIGGRIDHKGTVTQGNSHLYVSLTGEAARRLYESLGGDSIDDVCTGYRLKSRGNVICYEIAPGARYSCGFSINLDSGTVEAGLGGCI